MITVFSFTKVVNGRNRRSVCFFVASFCWVPRPSSRWSVGPVRTSGTATFWASKVESWLWCHGAVRWRVEGVGKLRLKKYSKKRWSLPKKWGWYDFVFLCVFFSDSLLEKCLAPKYPKKKSHFLGFALRCLEKVNILPNGGFLVICHGTKWKVTLNKSKFWFFL